MCEQVVSAGEAVLWPRGRSQARLEPCSRFLYKISAQFSEQSGLAVLFKLEPPNIAMPSVQAGLCFCAFCAWLMCRAREICECGTFDDRCWQNDFSERYARYSSNINNPGSSSRDVLQAPCPNFLQLWTVASLLDGPGLIVLKLVQ